MKFILKEKSILPGFGLSLGFTLFYLGFLVLIPIAALFIKTSSMHWSEFVRVVTSPEVMSSYRISFGCAFIAALINAVFGLLVAWVFTRYTFPGKKIFDVLIDLPFALPTAVAGITLTTLYASHGLIGELLGKIGIQATYNPLGIIIALTFIGFPFVVRTVQPVLEDLDRDMEEASACLGANRFQTFIRIILPPILPALLTGFGLSFARALGEYGSVVFISGNIPMKTEIVPLLIITKLEQYEYPQATAIAVVMLTMSFILLFLINILQWKTARSHKAEL